MANSSLVKASDDPADYKGEYLAEAKKAIGDIVFTYTVAGTMYKGARVTLTLGTEAEGWPVFRSNNVIVTGAKLIKDDSSEKVVVAELEGTVQAGKPITFRYKGAVVPDITTFRVDTFTVMSSSPLEPLGDDDPREGELDVGGSPITVNLVGANNLGKLAASVAQATSEHVIGKAGEAPGTLVLTYTAAAGMAVGRAS